MYFKAQDGSLHFLSEEDIANGGIAFLPLGSIEISDAEAAADRAPTLKQLRIQRFVEINAHAARLLAALSAAYPDGEVQSWPQQTREAEALAADPQAQAPLLTTIAAERGLSVAELASRVLAKVQAYAVNSGQIIGRRQKLEDAITAVNLDTPDAAEQLAAIQWPVGS